MNRKNLCFEWRFDIQMDGEEIFRIYLCKMKILTSILCQSMRRKWIHVTWLTCWCYRFIISVLWSILSWFFIDDSWNTRYLLQDPWGRILNYIDIMRDAQGSISWFSDQQLHQNFNFIIKVWIFKEIIFNYLNVQKYIWQYWLCQWMFSVHRLLEFLLVKDVLTRVTRLRWNDAICAISERTN
jgi:hypothetical protein